MDSLSNSGNPEQSKRPSGEKNYMHKRTQYISVMVVKDIWPNDSWDDNNDNVQTWLCFPITTFGVYVFPKETKHILTFISLCSWFVFPSNGWETAERQKKSCSGIQPLLQESRWDEQALLTFNNGRYTNLTPALHFIFRFPSLLLPSLQHKAATKDNESLFTEGLHSKGTWRPHNEGLIKNEMTGRVRGRKETKQWTAIL